MSISWTGICNQALAKIGAKSISNIDTDDSNNAIKCRALYENVRDELLRAYGWNCAIERARLARLATTPSFGYSYEYTLPTEPYCLRVLNMDGDYEFRIEGRKLLTNEDTCKIRYIKRITNPTQLDSLFIKAMVADLASQLAIAITNSNTIKDRMDREVEFALLKAKRVNAMEGIEEDLDKAETDLWVDAGR